MSAYAFYSQFCRLKAKQRVAFYLLSISCADKSFEEGRNVKLGVCCIFMTLQIPFAALLVTSDNRLELKRVFVTFILGMEFTTWCRTSFMHVSLFILFESVLSGHFGP